jgi:hypothetical protein
VPDLVLVSYRIVKLLHHALFFSLQQPIASAGSDTNDAVLLFPPLLLLLLLLLLLPRWSQPPWYGHTRCEIIT